jgi:hypothetical protein
MLIIHGRLLNLDHLRQTWLPLRPLVLMMHPCPLKAMTFPLLAMDFRSSTYRHSLDLVRQSRQTLTIPLTKVRHMLL